MKYLVSLLLYLCGTSTYCSLKLQSKTCREFGDLGRSGRSIPAALSVLRAMRALVPALNGEKHTVRESFLSSDTSIDSANLDSTSVTEGPTTASQTEDLLLESRQQLPLMKSGCMLPSNDTTEAGNQSPTVTFIGSAALSFTSPWTESAQAEMVATLSSLVALLSAGDKALRSLSSQVRVHACGTSSCGNLSCFLGLDKSADSGSNSLPSFGAVGCLCCR